MSHPAPAARRPSVFRPVRGLRFGQVIAWQLIALAGIAALALPSPGRWALWAVAAASAALTGLRWGHRWAYEWAWTLWEFRRAARDQPEPGRELPVIDVAPVRIRGGSKAALVHDGSGFAVIISAEPAAGSPRRAGLSVDTLASLMESGDSVVSAVQFVVHSDCSASDVRSATTAAYRNLGHGTVPRSQTTWIVLRHDPMASGYSVSAVGAPADVCASLARTLAARGHRTVQILGSHGLRAELLSADAARAVLDEAMVSGSTAMSADGPAADDGWGPRWCHWDNRTATHITYWLRYRPGVGLAALQQTLAGVPAYSVTTAVTLAPGPGGRLAMTGAVRVAFDPEIAWSRVNRRVRRDAASCGARLVPLHGEHASGVLATLPLGRQPGRSARWPGSRQARQAVLSDTLPVSAGGLIIGIDAYGEPVVLPLFSASRGTRICVAGHPAVSRLLALRALGAGARVQVITARSADWLKLRTHVSVPVNQMVVVQPGTPLPAAGSRAVPWLVIDDSGLPAAAHRDAWHADVWAPLEVPLVPGALGGLDAILFERAGPAAAAVIAAAFGLTGPGSRVAVAVPSGCVAVVLPGSARVARLLPDPREQAALAASFAGSGEADPPRLAAQ